METKIILISGGSSGIGYAYAKVLSEKNKVIIISRNTKNLKKVSEELKCKFEICDITNPDSIVECLNKISKKYKKIDVLINNAGIWIDGSLENNEYSEITASIDTNLKGQIFLTKAALPLLRKTNKALIVNTISDAGKTVRKELSVYNASKWGLEGFAGAMREELKEETIKIINVYPGGVDTPFFEKANSPRNQSKYLNPLIIAEIIKNNIKLYFDEDTIVDEVRLRHLK
jgi:NADP-dependent 3-hydroxy acid dehydrogenase YdfG